MANVPCHFFSPKCLDMNGSFLKEFFCIKISIFCCCKGFEVPWLHDLLSKMDTKIPSKRRVCKRCIELSLP